MDNKLKLILNKPVYNFAKPIVQGTNITENVEKIACETIKEPELHKVTINSYNPLVNLSDTTKKVVSKLQKLASHNKYKEEKINSQTNDLLNTIKRITHFNKSPKPEEITEKDENTSKIKALLKTKIKHRAHNTKKTIQSKYNLIKKTPKKSHDKALKPKLINRIQENNIITEIYDDGSKTIHTIIGEGKTKIEHFNPENILIEKIEEHDIWCNGAEIRKLHIINKDNNIINTETYTRRDGYKRETTSILSKNKLGENILLEQHFSDSNGEWIYKPTKTDALGRVIEGKTELKYTLSKDAKAKSGTMLFKFIPNNMGGIKIETVDKTVITKNGAKIKDCINLTGSNRKILGIQQDGTPISVTRKELYSLHNDPLEQFPEFDIENTLF